MATLLRINHVKTRKEHRCFACLKKFPKGTTMEVATSLDGGSIHDSYVCAECEVFLKEHFDLCFDPHEQGFHEGCVRDARDQYKELLEGGSN